MTARLPDEQVRVTSWLAGWVDYMFAVVLVAGRWLRAPFGRTSNEPVMLSAFAPAMADSYAPRWNDSDEPPASGRLVKTAEIVMLSLSFFLAAHLLSGGTETVTAPNLNPLGLLPDHAHAEAAHAETAAVPAQPGREVTVNAGSFIEQATVAPAVALEPSLVQSDAALAPAASPEAETAAVPAATPAPVVEEPAAAPPPPPPPVAAATAAPEPAPAGRYLTTEEVHNAAIAAGWPAVLLPEVEAVAWCESTFFSHATNYGAFGLMQMMGFWFTEAGLDPEAWADPIVNLRAALFAYNEQIRNGGDGWGPWTCKP